MGNASQSSNNHLLVPLSPHNPMTTIQINTLKPAGSDLFADQESYLKELSDAELNQSMGGSLGRVLDWLSISSDLRTL